MGDNAKRTGDDERHEHPADHGFAAFALPSAHTLTPGSVAGPNLSINAQKALSKCELGIP